MSKQSERTGVRVPPKKGVQKPTAKPKKAEKRKTPWRDNLEAFSMAVVVALLLKYFLIEVSKIPSGSMQPTLMGSPESGVFDRVIVDKLSFVFRDPERFEIVVFKHPLERSRNMVKRIVGLPNESLKIEHGDLWVKGADEDGWRVLRRPRSVQEAQWRRLQPTASWRPSSGTNGWKVSGAEALARGDGSIELQAKGSIRDGLFDGYPDAMVPGRVSDEQRGAHSIGDLRLEASVRALAGCEEVVLEIGEGQRSYRFHLPGPAADASAAPSIEVLDRAGRFVGSQRVDIEPVRERGDPWQLEAGDWTDVRVQNVDDVLELAIDGDWVLELAIEANANQQSSLEIEVVGEGADFDELAVWRDVFYLPGGPAGPRTRGGPPPLQSAGVEPLTEVTLGEDEYFMLGDNTQNSADGRDWRVIEFSWAQEGEGPATMRGNYRMMGENPSNGAVSVDGVPSNFLRDVWGERRPFPVAGEVTEFEHVPAVPRELIQGRAVLVFWPLKPIDGIWRTGWVR